MGGYMLDVVYPEPRYGMHVGVFFLLCMLGLMQCKHTYIACTLDITEKFPCPMTFSCWSTRTRLWRRGMTRTEAYFPPRVQPDLRSPSSR